MPDTGDTERPDCGNQADDQSNEASVTSQQPRRRRFLPRLRKRRTTDNAEQASPQAAAKKSKISLLGIAITALAGFFFGIGSNQVTDYVKRADDCNDALSQYTVGVASKFVTLSDAEHDPSKSQAQRDTALSEHGVDPRPLRSEYLNSDEVKQWRARVYKMGFSCFWASKCSHQDAWSYAALVVDSTDPLLYEAREVSQWGLVRRAKYEVTHLY
jgi:hypothetical protein